MNQTAETTKIRAILDAGQINGHDIAYMLSLRGYSQRGLATELGLVPTTVSNVIANREKSFHVAAAVAEILNTSIERLWPNTYPAPSLRKPTRRTV